MPFSLAASPQGTPEAHSRRASLQVSEAVKAGPSAQSEPPSAICPANLPTPRAKEDAWQSAWEILTPIVASGQASGFDTRVLFICHLSVGDANLTIHVFYFFFEKFYLFT